jgi:hypothetical protein
MQLRNFCGVQDSLVRKNEIFRVYVIKHSFQIYRILVPHIVIIIDIVIIIITINFNNVLQIICRTNRSVPRIYIYFLVRIPCIIEYVENDQQNALSCILLFISCDGSYMFRQ